MSSSTARGGVVGFEGHITQRVEVDGAFPHRRPKGASMLADLDLLLIAVFCAADDLLPQRAKNARRILTDAEVVTLCVAQAIMGVPSDHRFARIASKQLRHLFPQLTRRSGFYKRRKRLSDTIEQLIDQFARMSPGYHDPLLLVDSTPV